MRAALVAAGDHGGGLFIIKDRVGCGRTRVVDRLVHGTLVLPAVLDVAGAPLAKTATLTELGVAARLSANSLLELGYTSMLADEGHDSGVNARFSVQF